MRPAVLFLLLISGFIPSAFGQVKKYFTNPRVDINRQFYSSFQYMRPEKFGNNLKGSFNVFPHHFRATPNDPYWVSKYTDSGFVRLTDPNSLYKGQNDRMDFRRLNAGISFSTPTSSNLTFLYGLGLSFSRSTSFDGTLLHENYTNIPNPNYDSSIHTSNLYDSIAYVHSYSKNKTAGINLHLGITYEVSSVFHLTALVNFNYSMAYSGNTYLTYGNYNQYEYLPYSYWREGVGDDLWWGRNLKETFAIDRVKMPLRNTFLHTPERKSNHFFDVAFNLRPQFNLTKRLSVYGNWAFVMGGVHNKSVLKNNWNVFSFGFGASYRLSPLASQ